MQTIVAVRNAFGLLIAVSLAGVAGEHPKPRHAMAAGSPFRNTAPGVAYVGSQACRLCHPDVYREYFQTGMGRSMSLPSEPEDLAKVPQPVTVVDKQSGKTFVISREGSDLYQCEYQVDAQGREISRNTHKVAYGVDAGENGLSDVVRWGDYLVEAPLLYYAKARTWELSPGYERLDYGFARPVPGVYRDLPFHESAFSCETCHGPGQLHVAARMK